MVKKHFAIDKFSAWILMIIFMLPIVLKSFHDHDDKHICCHIGDTHDEQQAEDNSCDSCPICHFSYSLFTSAEILSSDIVVTLTTGESTIYFTQEYLPVFHSYNLRAPPAIC